MKEIYHGTISKGLETIQPRKRYTPGGGEIADSIKPRIYATYNPAYAVAHSFPWSSDDGIDIAIEGGMVTVIVPEDKQQVLEQEVCVYALPDDTFELTSEEETGLTYHSSKELEPLRCECFKNVIEAMDKKGGKIKLI